MDLKDRIELYLNKQRMVARTSTQVYELIADEEGTQYLESVKKLLTQRAMEDVSPETFYDIVSRKEIQGTSLYDLFASRARKAIVWNLEKVVSEIFPSCTSILDVGCGTGLVSCFVGTCYPEMIIEGIDISQGMIEAAKKRAESLKLVNMQFFKRDFQEHEGKKYDLIAGIHALDESCNTETDESERIFHLRSLLTEKGKLVLIRAGIHRREGFDQEREVLNACDFRESMILGLPPELVFYFNDADGEGFSQGLTIWGKGKA